MKLTYPFQRAWYMLLTPTCKCIWKGCPRPWITTGPWSLFSRYCREHTDEIVSS